MKTFRPIAVGLSVLAFTAISVSEAQSLRDTYNESIRYTGDIDFPQRIGARGDVDRGRRAFGFADDGVTQDPTEALFSGDSLIAGHVESNGRTCATCHRGEAGLFLGLPPLPLHSTIPFTDVLFTGLRADVGDDPDGLPNFDNLGLLLHRPTRLDPLFSPSDPRRQVFFWRSTNRLINTVFGFGFLHDGRMRQLVETTRGAVFTHTQDFDLRFDDITNAPMEDKNRRLLDISAFMEDTIDPPELKALLDPNDPDYHRLSSDPFATVPISTHEQRDGSRVFKKFCMDCHNMPNVFLNRDHVNNPPEATPPPYGHTFDIGVSQRNFHNLEFRRFDVPTGTRVPILLPLAKQDGSTVTITVVDDIGLASATGRYEDLHKFKVPQLRRISQLGPYFHDNTVQTLDGVVDYFNGPEYNSSPDGRNFPIHLTSKQRRDLLAFLRIL
jgi:hypothetical protein